VILFIVQYSKQVEKSNIRFIERIATDWVDKGVETIEQAEEQVRLLAMQEEAWAIVCKAFGIERRKPTKKENEFAFTWVNDWKLSSEMLEHAYEICVDTKSKFSFAYVAKILENWHNNGYKTVNDIVKKPKEDKMQGAYNIDLFEELINSKD
jgi:DnaD/phage-associated family protein